MLLWLAIYLQDDQKMMIAFDSLPKSIGGWLTELLQRSSGRLSKAKSLLDGWLSSWEMWVGSSTWVCSTHYQPKWKYCAAPDL